MINFLQTVPIEPQPGFMQQYSFIIMIGLMVLVLWLFMWRPEAKRRKQMQEFRNGLKKGDKVITAGGIYGVALFGYMIFCTLITPRISAALVASTGGYTASFIYGIVLSCVAVVSMYLIPKVDRKPLDAAEKQAESV